MTRTPLPKCPLEHQEQVRLVGHIRAFFPDLVLFSVPNGAAVRRAHRMRLVAEGLLAGVPDLFLAEPAGKYHGLFIEMKIADKTARVSAAQTKVHMRLRANGYAVAVCHGKDEALRAIADYLKGE